MIAKSSSIYMVIFEMWYITVGDAIRSMSNLYSLNDERKI